MAEILGTAAAALQLAETVYRLKKLCSDIQGMPAELNSMIEDITILADLLVDVRNNHIIQSNDSSIDERTWQKCFQLFTTSVESARLLTADLQSKLTQHPKTGCVRIYLKRDELAQCRDKLERTKATMAAAQQSYSFAVLTQQNALVLKEVRSIAMDQKDMTNALIVGSSSSRRPIDSSNALATSLTPSNYPEHSRGQTIKAFGAKHRSSTHEYTVRLPHWLFRRGLSVLLEKTSTSWGVTFRIYNRLPPDSDLFKFAAQNDWDNVWTLFSTGRASPFDLDDTGSTLLHWAAMFANVEACRRLVQCNVDPLRVHDGSLSSFECLGFVKRSGGNPSDGLVAQRMIDVMRLFTDASDFDESNYDMMFSLLFGLSSSAAMTVIETLPFTWQCMPSGYKWILATAGYLDDPDWVYVALGYRKTLHDAFWHTERSRVSFFSLHRYVMMHVAYMLGRLHREPHVRDKPALLDWMKILRETVAFEKQSTARSTFWSPASCFIDGYLGSRNKQTPKVSKREKNFTKLTRLWVSLLKEFGADLSKYGACEKEYCLRNWHMPDVETSREGEYFHIRPEMKYVVYGPEVDDWSCYVVPISEETNFNDTCGLIGEFFAWVEDPELFGIPGAFVGDPTYEDGWREGFYFVNAPCL